MKVLLFSILRAFMAAKVMVFLLLMSNTVVAKEYYIYGEDRNGSKFKQRIYSSPVPLNKGFKKLNDEQKATVLKDYPQLTEGDSPPFPKKGLGKILKPYVEEFQMFSHIEGGTFVVNVDENGKVSDVYSDDMVYSDVVSFVSETLYRLPFDPAICGGEPCAGEFVLILKKIEEPECRAC